MYDFNKEEKEILEFWKKNRILEKLRKKNKDRKKFSFIDGPITANNPMGVHHAWGRTYKDLFQRFKAMQGRELRYQNGFDSQGLWIEREEEKELGLKNKKDIEKFGIKRFVESCKARVKKFSEIQKEQSIRLGYWMDWENSYYTNTNANNLHNWFLLKKYFDKGWLYKGHDAVPWCWRCGTASSKHDIVTEGYKEVIHKSLFMKFPIKEKKKEFFLIFTTTPWTVPANVVIAVNEKIVYVKVKQGEEYFWIAEKRLNELNAGGDYEIIEKKKGKNLHGMNYDMPYKNLSQQKSSPHKVVLWNLVSEDEGTGIVHVAPGCGAEDCELGKKLNLPAIAPLDEEGVYRNDYEQFSGKKYSEVNKMVLEDLEERDFVYKIENYKHRYPHCWRCGEELVFRLVDEWYIKCDEIRNKLIKENKKIKWYPEYGKIRQEDWFNAMSDWLISRKRFYGLPLPIWECKCGKIFVAGSLKELKERAVDKKKIDSLKEIHRPWIDEIKIICKECGEHVERIPDVGDAWLDAGIVPFSTLNYIEDKEKWRKWFPADFITENFPGQYRGWFNSLFWASVAITGKAPSKSVFGYETVKDEKGEEMHKSKGNAIWFDDAVEKIGADVMRLLYCLQDPSQELRFGFGVMKEPKNNLNILYNLSKLVKAEYKNAKIEKIEDKWILSKFNSLIKKVTDELESLHPHLATRALQDFWLNELSRSYIQMIRERLNEDDNFAKYVLKEIYIELLKLCAPIIPFLTEKIWQELKAGKVVEEESVHLCNWPMADEKLISESLEKEFENALKIIELGLAERDKAKIGLKWPLTKVVIYIKGKENFVKFEKIIKSQLNVKKIEWKSPSSKGTEFFLEFDINITPELEAEGFAREISRNIQAFRKKLGLQKKQKVNTIIITDEKFKKILNSQIKFMKDRTNSKNLEIVTTHKERFKNRTGFKIKDKRGEIVLEVV